MGVVVVVVGGGGGGGSVRVESNSHRDRVVRSTKSPHGFVFHSTNRQLDRPGS